MRRRLVWTVATALAGVGCSLALDPDDFKFRDNGSDDPDSGTDTDNDSDADSDAHCGDKAVSGNEECDDGNLDNSDGCLNTCKKASCGDGYIWVGQETCDGDCPISCIEDGGPCMTESLAGNPDECTAQCERTYVSSCDFDDGCCPSECDGGIDNDCQGCPGWFDAASGLCWQPRAVETAVTWKEAIALCDDSVLYGFNNWRLPKVQELLSLLRGCDAGVCGVTDPDCLREDPCHDDCTSCSSGEGPAKGGCYFNPELFGRCDEFYWSASEHSDETDNAWYVHFRNGYVFGGYKSYSGYSRCVRLAQ